MSCEKFDVDQMAFDIWAMEQIAGEKPDNPDEIVIFTTDVNKLSEEEKELLQC